MRDHDGQPPSDQQLRHFNYDWWVEHEQNLKYFAMKVAKPGQRLYGLSEEMRSRLEAQKERNVKAVANYFRNRLV